MRENNYKAILLFLLRIAFFLLILFSIFSFSPMLSIAVTLFVIPVFHFYEFLLIGMVLDSVYAGNNAPFVYFFFTALCLCAISVSWFIRKRIKRFSF